MGESAAARHTEGVQAASYNRLLTRRVSYDKYISIAKMQTQWALGTFLWHVSLCPLEKAS